MYAVKILHLRPCYLLMFPNRVSTTPENLLEFKNPPGNLEFNWSSWKFLCKMSKINRIGFQSQNWVPDRLLKKLVALFYLCYGPKLYKMHIILLVGAHHYMLH